MIKKPTLRDVAKEAGVSVATVSYVLNNVSTQTIPADTRERVLASCQKLGYIQNLTARSLSLGRSNLLGVLLVGDESDFISKHISYGKFIDRLERISNANNYHLMVTRIDPHQPNFAIIAERKLDGVFLIDACESSFHAVAEKFPFGSPLILIDGFIEDQLFRKVTPDFDLLFTAINTYFSDSRPYAILHERYHNRSLTAAITAASGIQEADLYSVSSDNEELHAFLNQQQGKQLVVFNEFLALRLMKYVDPSNMLVICTSDCPEYLPDRAGRIVLAESKAQTASEMMQAMLLSPYNEAPQSGLLAFRLAD